MWGLAQSIKQATLDLTVVMSSSPILRVELTEGRKEGREEEGRTEETDV